MILIQENSYRISTVIRSVKTMKYTFFIEWLIFKTVILNIGFNSLGLPLF